ncbi:hypothetical protein [Microlunatus sp. GCM10028923]|uniref:nucleotidyltransferase domain-containing protein n=1 Tax=Microlunatus sp. GCM10028923 TaxID=3273400 RepID=UPI003623974D
MADARDLVDHHVELLSALPGVRAVLLGGSLARDAADRWSDLDLMIVAADGVAPADLADAALAAVTGADEPLLVIRRESDHHCLLNLVLPPWTRVDLSVTDDQRPGGPRMPLRQVYGEPLDLTPPPGDTAVDLDGAAAVITQFVRVYGLLPVVLGRDDLVTSVQGCHLIWGELVKLCLLIDPETGRMGALSKAQRILPEHRDLLLALPAIAPDRRTILAFHEAAWSALLAITASGPLAEADWPPERTLQQLRSWLQQTVGLTLALPGTTSGSGDASAEGGVDDLPGDGEAGGRGR